MKMAFTPAITAVTAIAGLPAVAASAEPVHSVRGSGTFTGNGVNDTVAIHAWTDEAGNAFGTISWEDTAVFAPGAGPG